MFELATFGGIVLRNADGGQTVDLVRHPRQLALLVYLTVEGRPATRDELIRLLWADATEPGAPQRLNRAVRNLRRVLGGSAIVTHGQPAARQIAPDVIQPDTAAFDVALAAERWSDAVTLYRGEFLDGFRLPDGHEFDDWARRIRERYRRAALRALAAYADQLGAEGNVLELARQLTRACEIAPEREDLAAAAIDAFASADETSVAVDWFAQYTRRFAEAFDQPPPPALAARVDLLRDDIRHDVVTVPAALDDAETEPVNGASDPDPSRSREGRAVSGDGVNEPASTRTRRRRWLPRRSAAIVATIGVIAAIAGAIRLRVGDAAPSDPRAAATMLISIANRTPGAGWPHLAEALEQTMAARLANPPRLHVAIRPEPIDGPNAAGSPTAARPRGPGREVDFVLAGTVQQTADRVRIELRMSAGASDRVIRTLRISRPRHDVFAVLDGTAEALADTLRPLLGTAISSNSARTRTASTVAWTDLEHSKAMLADARRFAVRGASARAAALLDAADSLTRRATRTDPRWVDARLHSAQIERGRSVVRLTSAPPDVTAASAHLANAAGILMDAVTRWPDDVRLHELAGTVAFERWLATAPYGPERQLLGDAVRSLERAIFLDPYAARPWVVLSDVHAARDEHAASAVAAHRALDRDAFAEHTDEIQNRLFHAHFELGQDEDAARWCDEINQRAAGRALGAFCELNLQVWSSVREPDLALADSLIEGLDADPPAFAAMMRPRLRMLQAAAAARLGDTRTARRLLDDAVAATRRAGDVEAASFHAAALIRFGELDAAQKVFNEWMKSGAFRVPVERWFHEIDAGGTARLES